MILFAGAMTTANFGETTPPEPPPITPAPAFRRPADYYSAPTPEAAFPQWLSLGCGAAALVVLIIVFAAGGWLSSGGFGEVMDLTIGMSLGELRGMYAKDLQAVDKDALEKAVETMRKNVQEKRVDVASLRPFLQQLSASMRDGTASADEVRRLTATATRINAGARKR
ncbi:MAG: hypothetical protein QOH21_1016 [Acidobacteriota bacterium]|jgi:hypothetical protein|nr:hypothetical protein [Acidobacteriota bacterium]